MLEDKVKDVLYISQLQNEIQMLREELDCKDDNLDKQLLTIKNMNKKYKNMERKYGFPPKQNDRNLGKEWSGDDQFYQEERGGTDEQSEPEKNLEPGPKPHPQILLGQATEQGLIEQQAYLLTQQQKEMLMKQLTKIQMKNHELSMEITDLFRHKSKRIHARKTCEKIQQMKSRNSTALSELHLFIEKKDAQERSELQNVSICGKDDTRKPDVHHILQHITKIVENKSAAYGFDEFVITEDKLDEYLDK